jgi:hypothetical protein
MHDPRKDRDGDACSTAPGHKHAPRVDFKHELADHKAGASIYLKFQQPDILVQLTQRGGKRFGLGFWMTLREASHSD